MLPRCRHLLIIRNCINFPLTHFASFHSTPVFNDKWKNKWKFKVICGYLLAHGPWQCTYKVFARIIVVTLAKQAIPFKLDGTRRQQPSKNSARYTTREKRADTKRALNSLLSHYGELGTTFANDESWGVPKTKGCDTESMKKGRSKSKTRRPEKIHNQKMRRKYRKGYMSDEYDDYPETIFQATFGDKQYTWASNRNGSSRRSTPEFDWREAFYKAKGGREEWEKLCESDSEEATCNVGLPSDRALLGLPRIGPLKMEDVKYAFRSSALKWHPDKHQGASQAAAEEKFKLCVTAYKSLCSALSGA